MEPEQIKDDDELDNLLESTLEDLEKIDNTTKNTLKSPNDSINTNSIPNSPKITANASISDDKNEKGEVTGQELATILSGISQNDPPFFEEFATFVKEIQNNPTNNASELFNRAQDKLNDDAKAIEEHSQDENEQMIKQLIDQFENNPQLHEMMEGMMKQLMDKDILYEPMKEMREKYPNWLNQNQEKLSKEDFDRYNKQYDYVKQICAAYENEGDNFQKILQLMQEMQECGKPPLDIVKELAPGIELGAEGLPTNIFGNNEKNPNCSLM